MSDKIKESVEQLTKLEGQAVSFFTRVVTLTPILLTVLATVLAGLSSGEMTRSMYYRSLAAQHQAKVADQWAFFQAKRMRGAIAEAERERRPVFARPGPDSALLVDHMDRLAREIDRVAHEAAQARGRLPLGGAQKAAQDLLTRAESAALDGARLRGELRQILPAHQDLFRHFGTGAFPDHAPSALAPAVEQARQAIQRGQPEAEVNRILAGLSEESLHGAVTTVGNDTHAFEDLRDRIQQELDRLSVPVKDLLARAGTLHQVLRSFETRCLFTDPPDSAGAESVRKQLEPLTQADAAVRQAADELKEFWAAALDEFTAWRYAGEARDTRRLAEVLEVQVHKSSFQADRHHQRSQNFFFGMLAAQAGVVISSMAVAARRKSSLWLLASLAGVVALGFSAWVYLSL